MALIKCSECGREVSDRAASCPHCGCPIHTIGGYTVTYTIRSMGMMASGMHNNSVAAITQSVTRQVQNAGGKLVDIKYGQVQSMMMMTTQTIVYIYEAPEKVFMKTNCTLTIEGGLTPRPKYEWYD